MRVGLEADLDRTLTGRLLDAGGVLVDVGVFVRGQYFSDGVAHVVGVEWYYDMLTNPVGFVDGHTLMQSNILPNTLKTADSSPPCHPGIHGTRDRMPSATPTRKRPLMAWGPSHISTS